MKHNAYDDRALFTQLVYPSVISSTLRVIDVREDLFAAREGVDSVGGILETVRADNFARSPYLLSEDSSVLRREAAIDLQRSESEVVIAKGIVQDLEYTYDTVKLEQQTALDDLGLMVLLGITMSTLGAKRSRKRYRSF
jgi:hypothetical protein